MADVLSIRHPVARTRIWFALRVVVAIGLLATVWTFAGGTAALDRLASVQPGWLLLALVTVNLQTVLSARRWQITAAPLGLRIGLRRAIAEYYLSQLVNQSLPGGVLGDAGRAVRSRHVVDLGTAAQAVVIERLLGQVALLAVFAAGVLILAASAGPSALLGPATGLLGLAGLAMAGIVCIGFIAPALVPRLRQFRTAAVLVLRQSTLNGGLWLRQGALSLVIVACNIAAFVFCFEATGSALAPGIAMVLIPLILLAMLVPLTIGGWGLREGTAAALFPLAGGTAEAGFAASVTFGLVLLVSALPGAVAIVRHRDAAP